MCSTNPGSWVTFDDDSLFQSSPKKKDLSLETQGVCRPNGLKLDLPGLRDLPNTPSSTGSTPLSSPMVDFYFSPGPPSNSPLSTPTTDFPGFPGIPKAGTHVLYPIPECSSSSPPTTAGGAGPPLSLTKPTCSPHVSLPSGHSHTQLTPTAGLTEDASPRGVQSEARQFEYFQDDCAFSNPFWKDEGGNSQFPFDSLASRKLFSPRDKEVPDDQKSLNQCSLNYICEKLEHLQSAETQDPLGNLSMQSSYAGGTFSFVPHTLFRSQPKAGWSFMLRIPEKKNMMSSRQWGPIFLKVLPGGILQMYYEKGLEKPFKEFQLNPHCRLSEPKLENFSMAGKIHTVKVEHVSYSEKRKYHSKVEVVHEPEVEQMLKLGSTEHRDFLEFLTTVEEELVKLPATAKPKNKIYEEQEIHLDILDSFWGKVTKEEGKLVESAVLTQVCCLCFLNGPAECFLALNDLELQKRDERYFEKEPEKRGIDILNYHFHTCVNAEEFERSRIIKFVPPDACRFELMRFRTSREGDELPFSVKSIVTVQGAYVELQAFVNMTPAVQRSPHAGSLRSCNNIMIHFPVPAQWIKALWTRNLQRQKSLKAKMNRRACLGSLQGPELEPVIQVTVGSAKYESAYRAVVWKIDRLPDKNTSPDQPHCLSYKLELGSDQEVPSDWDPFATVQFSMSEACASRTEVRSLGVESDAQPQKHVCQRACYNIQVEIEKKWIQIDGEDPDKAGGCVTQ